MPGNEELIKQLSSLTWDAKKLKEGEYKEVEGQKNDLADAFLYAHHFSRHMWYNAPKPKPPDTNQSKYNSITNMLMNRNRPTSVFGNIDFAEPNGR